MAVCLIHLTNAQIWKLKEISMVLTVSDENSLDSTICISSQIFEYKVISFLFPSAQVSKHSVFIWVHSYLVEFEDWALNSQTWNSLHFLIPGYLDTSVVPGIEH